MSGIEHRLHRAARELRELEIEPPPLSTLGGRRRPTGVASRLPALVMPALFVLGGLAVIVGGTGRHVDDDAAGAASAPADAVEHVERDVGATDAAPLTAREEIALITTLVPPEPRSVDARPATAPAATRNYR